MKYLRAYLSALRNGIASPTALDILKVLEAAGLDCDMKNATAAVTKLAGKTVAEVIAEGKVKLASVPSGGSAAPVAAAPSGGSVLPDEYLKAYLLVNLGGNASPSAQDILKVLEAGGLDCDMENATAVVTALAGKTVAEVIAEGKVKFASVPSGGSAAPAAAAPSGGSAPTADVRSGRAADADEGKSGGTLKRKGDEPSGNVSAKISRIQNLTIHFTINNY